MIPTNPKIGEIFTDNGAYYEVVSHNENGTFNSKILPGYVPPVKKEEKVAEVKAPVKKAPTVKATTKKK